MLWDDTLLGEVLPQWHSKTVTLDILGIQEDPPPPTSPPESPPNILNIEQYRQPYKAGKPGSWNHGL